MRSTSESLSFRLFVPWLIVHPLEFFALYNNGARLLWEFYGSVGVVLEVRISCEVLSLLVLGACGLACFRVSARGSGSPYLGVSG